MRRQDFLTVAEAAARFGVSRSTIERRRREGTLTAAPNPRDRREALIPLAQLVRVFGPPAAGDPARPTP